MVHCPSPTDCFLLPPLVAQPQKGDFLVHFTWHAKESELALHKDWIHQIPLAAQRNGSADSQRHRRHGVGLGPVFGISTLHGLRGSNGSGMAGSGWAVHTTLAGTDYSDSAHPIKPPPLHSELFIAPKKPFAANPGWPVRLPELVRNIMYAFVGDTKHQNSQPGV